MQLYNWQKDCLNAWKGNDFHGIVHAVTGSGKTVLALNAIDLLRDRFPDLRVKVVVPTVALAQQWKSALLRHAPTDAQRPGFFGGGVRDDPDKVVMLYVINSARGSLSAHIKHDFALHRHVLLICDECHHDQATQNRRIFDFLSPDIASGRLYHSLGLSATPFDTEDDSILTHALGGVIYQYGFDAAEKEGIVSPFTVCEVAASFMPHELEAYGELSDRIRILTVRLFSEHPQLRHMESEAFLRRVGSIARQSGMDPEEPAAAFLLAAYQRKQLSSLAQSRVRCGLGLLERLRDTDRVLIFCERIEQAVCLSDAIRRRFGNVCGIYHSQMTREARVRNLQEYRDGQTRILISCRSLDEGLDVPDANIGIVLSSTGAGRQRIQRLGRIIRSSPGKDFACLYYIYIRESSDNAAYLPGLEPCKNFSLRYYHAENSFSNDLYEYIAGELLRRAERQGMTQKQRRELRRCLDEGLTRADYLLPAETMALRAKKAQSVHDNNYWNAMKAVARQNMRKDGWDLFTPRQLGPCGHQ